ncbi:MAG TPA: hypothetical protein VG322_09830 [Candidatus Acidoferrales bacterium]|jgi:hypothetical protein|nr:hypothetical protein [Candidatus Acidoferrales bacterium]
MEIGPGVSFSDRLSLREFDAELWRLYFGFVKGLLMMLASIVYFPLVCLFFVVQHAAYGASKFVAWITQWNPEKPRAFDLREVDGD